MTRVIRFLSKENFERLSRSFFNSGQKLGFIGFLKTMLSITKNPNFKLRFVKNLIELFNNIDIDSNLILEWNELLGYIMQNQQFMDRRLADGVTEEERIEMNYIHKSDFVVRFEKKYPLEIQAHSSINDCCFMEKKNLSQLVMIHFKTFKIDIYINQFQKKTSFE